MMTIIRGLATGVVIAGAAIGLAGTASADPTDGSYTATIIDPGTSNKTGSITWNLGQCGQDCVRISDSDQTLWDLHRQGNAWTGTDKYGTQSLDNNSLVLTIGYSDGRPNVVIGLTKNG